MTKYHAHAVLPPSNLHATRSADRKTHQQSPSTRLTLLDSPKHFHAAGDTVTLKLPDATTTPVEHAQKLYKRAAKQRRAGEQLRPKMEEAEEQLEYLGEVQESLRMLDRFVCDAKLRLMTLTLTAAAAVCITLSASHLAAAFATAFLCCLVTASQRVARSAPWSSAGVQLLEELTRTFSVLF